MTLEEAHALLTDAKKGKLPVLNAAGELVSLISRTDLLKSRDFPEATTDATQNLMVRRFASIFYLAVLLQHNATPGSPRSPK